MIDYEEQHLARLIFRWEGSVDLRAYIWPCWASIIGVVLLYIDEWYPGQREDWGMLDVKASQIWAAATGTIAFLIGFRTNKAYARFWEGTTLLHQMRGEWFDTVSNCVTFSISAKKTKPAEVLKFRHAIVRLMSLAHGAALEEIAGDQVKLDTIDMIGLDHGTLAHLTECHDVYGFNKVEVMLHLIQSLIIGAADDGVVKVPPPILSRVFQTISRGFVNLLNAKKICDTRFPFPYAQVMSILLVGVSVFLPLMLTALIKSKVLVAIFSFVPVYAMFALNFIAMELENPFGTDANDLPLEHFQEEMNKCLLMLLHPNADLITSTSEQCIMSFDTLCELHNGVDGGDGTESAKLRQQVRLSGFTSYVAKTAKTKNTGSLAAVTEEEEEEEAPTAKPEARTDGLPLVPTAPEAQLSPDIKSAVAPAPANKPVAPDVESLKTLRVPVSTDAVELLHPSGVSALLSSEWTSTSGGSSPSSPMERKLFDDPLPKEVTGLTAESCTTADIDPVLRKHMNGVDSSISRWSEMIEQQVLELDRHCLAMKRFNDAVKGLHPLAASAPT